MRKRLCVVTGTSSGIGKTLAEVLLAQDWEVIGFARREASIVSDHYRHVRLDFADPEAVQKVFEGDFLGMAKLGDRERVALVNNAGVLGPVGPQEGLSAKELATTFNINTVAPIWLTGFFSKHCAERPLCVVNISSGAAYNALSGWSAYCSSKAALRMAGQVFGEDVAKIPSYSGRAGRVSVVNYSPGVVATPMQEQLRTYGEDQFPAIERFVGFHRDGALKDPGLPVAEIVALLGRDDLPPYSEVNYGAPPTENKAQG